MSLRLLSRLRAAQPPWKNPRTARLLWAAAFCVPPLYGRFLATWDLGLAVRWIDARGVASDLFVSLLLAAAFGLLARALDHLVTRVVTASAALLWAALSYGGYEHVVVNDAAIDVSLLTYLADETFVRGSLQPARPVALILMVGLATVAAWWGCRGLGAGARLWPILVPLVVTALVVRLWTPSLGEAAWRQQNFLEQAPERLANARATPDSPAPDEPTPLPDDSPKEASSPTPEPERPSGDASRSRLEATLGRDLRGDRLVPIPEGRPNVLLIFVEGASGAHLPAVASYQGHVEPVRLSRLSERAENEGFWATQMVLPQRQTNRGLYAALCGESPKLSSAQPKMSDYALAGERRCLPAVLKDEGYHTAYLQAAQLSFMMKDQFMARAGFDEVLGFQDFPQSYARSGWGIDDRALYEQVLERLVGYQALGKPWLAAVLNVGTHHPLPVPQYWRREPGESPKGRAFAYTDHALDRLLQALREKGLAENTLVVVTSDESQGLSDRAHGEVTHMLSKNWGPMVAFGPGIGPRRLDGVFSLSDTALSIVDYLGLADRAPHFAGRSWFRDHQGPREIAFANAHEGRQFRIGADGDLLVCKELEDRCEGHHLDPERLFGPYDGNKRRGVDAEEIAQLRALVAATETTALTRSDPETVRVDLVPPDARVIALDDEQRPPAVAGGQYLELQENERLRLRLAYSLDGPGSTVGTQLRIRRRISQTFGQSMHDPLSHGETIRLELTFFPGERISDLDVHFTADLETAGEHPRLVVEEAAAILEAAEPNARPGLEILEYTRIDDRGRESRVPWLQLTPRSGRLVASNCLKGGPDLLTGIDCPAGVIVEGPRAFAGTGAAVGAAATLQASPTQDLRGRFEIKVRRRGHDRVIEGETFIIEKGRRQEVTMSRHMRAYSPKTDVRLVLEEPSTAFRISGLRMWIRPDEDSVRTAPR